MNNSIKTQQARPKDKTKDGIIVSIWQLNAKCHSDGNIGMTYANSFYFRGLNDLDMEITVLDIQILKALHREVKEVSNLIAEMTAPTKHCNRQQNGSTNRKPANCSTSAKELCRRTGQKAFLGQRKSIGRLISDCPKWNY